MNINIKQVQALKPGQSVVCIVGKASVPSFLSLTARERKYALDRLKENEEYVYLNSCSRCIYLVPVDINAEAYRASEEIRKKASMLKRLIRSNSHKELVIASDKSLKGAELAFAEGFILAVYSFSRYKTVSPKKYEGSYPSDILLYNVGEKSEINWLKSVVEAVYLTRDLINEPPNRLNSVALAREIKKMSQAAGFSFEQMGKTKIEALKMGGLLAVNRGSVDPPVFCVLEWKPENAVNRKAIVLVGKGVIYDTGGLNIKTGDYMGQMKTDMAGAATVAGIFHVMAKNRIPVHLVGLIPVTDNRPGGNAYVQGDIITMYNGRTVEVGNTDAEGRLILADALSYADKYSPELIITIATLTGSASMTFGNLATAVMGNADERYFSMLREAGNEVYERIAPLPFWEEYGELLKSDIADIKNTGGREAGAITAGKFLEFFTEYPLIHLDIAGTGVLKKDDFYRTKEGTASGLRLIAEFLRKYSAGGNKKK